jgi:hypothetical protein
MGKIRNLKSPGGVASAGKAATAFQAVDVSHHGAFNWLSHAIDDFTFKGFARL